MAKYQSETYGTFAEDLRHWADVWVSDPAKKGSVLEHARLIWAHQSLQAIGIFRLSSLCARRGIPLLPGILHHLNVLFFGLDIVPSIPIGGGLYIPHPVGTVIMARRIGRNATLISNVTVGMRNTHDFPVIGDDVFIGAGARVLGSIAIGDGASIGANAVVISDVPPGATAVGVPAKVLQRRHHEAETRNP